MDWKKLARSALCLLVVCCILLNSVPVKTEAVAVVDDIAIGVTAMLILIAAGVVFNPQTNEDIKAIGNSFKTYMYQWGTSAEKLDEVEEFFSGLSIVDGSGENESPNMQKIRLARGILAGIASWCVSVILGTAKVFNPGGSGIKVVGAGADLQAEAWAESLGFYNLANSAAINSSILFAIAGPWLDTNTSYFGVSKRHHDYFGIDVLTLDNFDDLGTYNTSNFPMGVFCTGLVDSSNVANLFDNRAMFCLNYADANDLFIRYKLGKIDVKGSYISYFTESSYVYARYVSGSYGYIPLYLKNYKYIDLSNGSISTVEDNHWRYSSGLQVESRAIVPADYYIVDDPIYVGDLPGEIQSGTKTEEDIVIPDINYSDIIVPGQTPLQSMQGLADSLESGSITHEQYLELIQTEDTPSADPTVPPEPTYTPDESLDLGLSEITGNTFLEKLSSVLFRPIEWLLNGIKKIFVPESDFLSNKVKAILNEFAFAGSIVGLARTIADRVSSSVQEPPVIYIHLDDTRGSYDLGGTVPFIDMRWYAEYKPAVDTLLSSFLWIFFIWRLFIKLPGIIAGMPGDFVMDSLPPMVIDRLPSRSMDNEIKRMEHRDSVFKRFTQSRKGR